MKYNKIIFLVSSLSQPRAIRRVESIAALGLDVIVYGYDRKQYECNKFSKDILVNVLGEMSKGGNYLGKLNQIRSDVRAITSMHKGENCLYYSFGFLESFFLRSAKVPYVYEISDIAYSGGVLGRIRPVLYRIDQMLVKHSVFTLMTSEGFKKYLNVKDANIVIQPNKVNRKLVGCERNTLNLRENKFIFSFVGSIRYDPILRFAKVVGERFPQHEFHFYGVANVEYTKNVLIELTSNYKNIKLFGAFKNPESLEDIYNKVDVVVSTYGLSLNERILDPNKLYEGILFCRPIVVTEGTFLADQVRKFQCGFEIDSSTEESIAEFVISLSSEKVNSVSAREKLINDDFLFDDMKVLKSMFSTIVERK